MKPLGVYSSDMVQTLFIMLVVVFLGGYIKLALLSCNA